MIQEQAIHLTAPAGYFPASVAMNKLSAHPVTDAVLLDPRRDVDWDRMVASHPGSTIFHTSAWAKVLCDTYGHKPHYLRVSAAGRIMALVPMMEITSRLTGRRGVCLPFSDLCIPLTFDSGGTRDEMIHRLAEIGKEQKWNYFEFRGPVEIGGSVAPIAQFYGHSLDLNQGQDELLSGVASSVRRALRKAERSVLSVQIVRTEKAIREFYTLHSRTRRRHGVPPQPLSFFLNIHKNVVSQGFGSIVLAHQGSRPIAGAVFLHANGNAIYKFGASDERFLQLRANNLVMWKGIKHLAKAGCTTLHLGRTDLGHTGLRRFKLSFGAQEKRINYFRFAPAADRWMNPIPVSGRMSRASNVLFRRLPLTMNRLAGTVLYPHLD